MKHKLTIILLLFAILPACSSDDSGSSANNTNNQSITDMASDTSNASDLSTAGDMTTQADASGDGTDDMQSSSDAGSDASMDMDSKDGGNVCDSIDTELEAQRLAAGACERPSQCGSRYNPTCPDGGCYVHYNVSSDLTALENAETQYSGEMCGSGAVCDCAAPPEALSCDSGQCAPCPQTCSYVCNLDCECSKDACGCDMPVCAPSQAENNCDEADDRIAQARDDARGCTQDSDCIIDTSPLCPQVGCFFPRNRNASRADLDTLVAEYTGSGCPLLLCACAIPPTEAECVNGHCQGVTNQ